MDGEVVRLGSTGRRTRSIAAAVLLAGLAASALVGVDDWFPLAPFRMYATANSPNGAISVVGLEVLVEGEEWQRAPLRPSTVGLSVAEVEGQLPRLVADPELVAQIAQAHNQLHPGQPEWVGLRLVRVSQPLVDGRPEGDKTRKVLVAWTAA